MTTPIQPSPANAGVIAGGTGKCSKCGNVLPNVAFHETLCGSPGHVFPAPVSEGGKTMGEAFPVMKGGRDLQGISDCARCILADIDDEKWSVPQDPLWVPTIRAHASVIAQDITDVDARLTAAEAALDIAKHDLSMVRDGQENAIREAYKLLGIEDDGELRMKWVLLEIGKLRSSLTAAQAEVAELRKDKERLDWLADNSLWLFSAENGYYGFQCPILRKLKNSTSIRAAIDSARNPAEKKGGV